MKRRLCGRGLMATAPFALLLFACARTPLASAECDYVLQPWAIEPFVCEGCVSAWVLPLTNGTDGNGDWETVALAAGASYTVPGAAPSSKARLERCVPCAVHLEGCLPCKRVRPPAATSLTNNCGRSFLSDEYNTKSNRFEVGVLTERAQFPIPPADMWRCAGGDTTSSIKGICPAPNASAAKAPPPVKVREIDNSGAHPGRIRFERIHFSYGNSSQDVHLPSGGVGICAGLKEVSLDDLAFECVCDATCDEAGVASVSPGARPLGRGGVGRCKNGACQTCPTGFQNRGDLCLNTDCATSIKTLGFLWLGVLASSVFSAVAAFYRIRGIYMLTGVWQQYFTNGDDEGGAGGGSRDGDNAQKTDDAAAAEDDDTPLTVKISQIVQRMYFLVWRHDDGPFLLPMFVKSCITVFFIALPRTIIGEGAEIGTYGLVTVGYAVACAVDAHYVPELAMMLLTRRVRNNWVPRSNPFQMHVVLTMHKAFDSSYNVVKPLMGLTLISAPILQYILAAGHRDGTFSSHGGGGGIDGSLRVRVVPFKEQQTLYNLFDFIVWVQYAIIGSLTAWTCFVFSARFVYDFGKFAANVRKAAAEGAAEITDKRYTLTRIQEASFATQKISFFVTVAAFVGSGCCAMLVLFMFFRVRLSYGVPILMILIDICAIEISHKIQPSPRRLNGSSARRYIKVGTGFAGVQSGVGTFDERVSDDGEEDKSLENNDSGAEKDCSEDNSVDVNTGKMRGGFCGFCKVSEEEWKRRQRRKRKQLLRKQRKRARKKRQRVSPLDVIASQNAEQSGEAQGNGSATKPKKNFEYDDAETNAAFRNVGVDHDLKAKFFEKFCAIDVDGSGTIGFNEFMNHYSLLGSESNEFTHRVFRALKIGRKPTGPLELSFCDFVVGLTRFLTFTRGMMYTFAFGLYDDDYSGALTCDELEELVRDVWGTGALVGNSRLKFILNALDPNKDGSVDMGEWALGVKRHPMLMKPALMTQLTLRQKIFGVDFWEKKMHEMVKREQDKLRKGHQ